MKIIIFGASGATGSQSVSQALGQAHRVTAFVRTPSKLTIENENLKVVQGDVSNYGQVEDAVANQDVVLSALGASSPFIHDPRLIAGIQNIVGAMTKHGIRRLIYQSFLGLKEHRKELGFMVNVIMPMILRNVIADHEAKEGIIMKSDLDWTIVRCAILTNGPLTKEYRSGERIKSSSLIPLISRADVADFMLRQMTEPSSFHRKPRIMY